jgi:hypothetical protein
LLVPGNAPQSLVIAPLSGPGSRDVAFVDRDSVEMFRTGGADARTGAGDTAANPHELGTVVHVLEPTLTVTPGHEDAYFRLSVPREAALGSGDEVVDISALFANVAGPGLAMQVVDPATGEILASSNHAQVIVHQGATLLVHVFGLGGSGTGAYSLDVDVLPQVVSVEAQPLLPDPRRPGVGPCASLVITFQGDRLDPTTAEDPAKYQVVWFGPDDIAGTPDDQVFPVGDARYDPSANVDVATGLTYPTAIRQTVTLTFDTLLPTGSYAIHLGSDITAQPFSADEAALGSGAPLHALVQIRHKQIAAGASVARSGLVLGTGGSSAGFGAWTDGTSFFTQLHDDLGSLLDASLARNSDSNPSATTAALQLQILARILPALVPAGAAARSAAGVLVIWLDPISLTLDGPDGSRVSYDLSTNHLNGSLAQADVLVTNNTEFIAVPMPRGSSFDLAIDDVHNTARGGALIFNGSDNVSDMPLTDKIRDGVNQFTFTAPVETAWPVLTLAHPLVFLDAPGNAPGEPAPAMRNALSATPPPAPPAPAPGSTAPNVADMEIEGFRGLDDGDADGDGGEDPPPDPGDLFGQLRALIRKSLRGQSPKSKGKGAATRPVSQAGDRPGSASTSESAAPSESPVSVDDVSAGSSRPTDLPADSPSTSNPAQTAQSSFAYAPPNHPFDARALASCLALSVFPCSPQDRSHRRRIRRRSLPALREVSP